MCGIVGLINGEKANKIRPEVPRFLKQGLHTGIYRGVDSTGILRIDKDFESEILKTTLSGDEFGKQRKVIGLLDDSADQKAVIIHHRAATKGSVSWDNAHPFEHDIDDNRWLIGVHNGGVDYRTREDGIDFFVDSDHLYYRMTRDGAAKALGETRGAFALVWADMITKKIHIASNEERAIHFAPITGANTILIASEAAHLHWLASRNGISLDQIYRPKAGLIYTFDPAGDVRKFTATPFEVPVRKEVVKSNVAPRKSTFNPTTRKHETENESFKFEDSYGPSATQALKIDSGQDVLFNYRTAITSDKADQKFDVYGEVMDDNAEIMKAVILSMPRTLVDNVREAKDVYARIIGKRDVIDKKSGVVVPILLMAPPHIILRDEDPVEKFVREVSEDDDTAGARTVRGPEGKQIGLAKFLKAVDKGCSNCGDNIIVGDADEIGWVNGEQPVCSACCNTLLDSGFTVN